MNGRVNVTPAKAIEMAGKLYSRGQYPQADRVCRQIIESRPGNADAHNILGVSLAALGESDEAIDRTQPGDQDQPEGPSYHANLGEVLRLAGKLDEAARRSKTRSSWSRTTPRRSTISASLITRSGNSKRRSNIISAPWRINPQMPEALNNLGNASRTTGDIDGAMHAYQDTLTSAPSIRRPTTISAPCFSRTAIRGSRARAAKGDPAEPALCRGAQQPRPVALRPEEGPRRAAGARRCLEVRAQERADTAAHRQDPAPAQQSPGGRASDATGFEGKAGATRKR